MSVRGCGAVRCGVGGSDGGWLMAPCATRGMQSLLAVKRSGVFSS